MNLKIVLIALLVILTGCPYKRVYIAIPPHTKITKDLTIIPVTVFYMSTKNDVEYGASYKVTNNRSIMQEINFSKSILLTFNDTLKPIHIFSMGNLVQENFQVQPLSDTLVGVYFRGKQESFGDTVKVILASPHIIYDTFFYKRIRR